MVVKLALPSAPAYSLVASMKYCLQYGIDQLEIILTTRRSVALAEASGPGVGVQGSAGGGGTAPTASTLSATVTSRALAQEMEKEQTNVKDNTQWRENLRNSLSGATKNMVKKETWAC